MMIINHKEQPGFGIHPHSHPQPFGYDGIQAIMAFARSIGLQTYDTAYHQYKLTYLVNQSDHDSLEARLLSDHGAHVVHNPGGSWDWLYFDSDLDRERFVSCWWGR
jgi:hypothetical protein